MEVFREDESKTLDKNIPVPLYYQLKELISDAIKEKQYRPGDAIPTEKEIGRYYQLSRTTVRQAIGELVQEGVLYRVKSKGTFVAEPKIRQEYIRKIQSFNDEMLQKGMMPSTEVLAFEILNGEEIPPEAKEILCLDKTDAVIFLHRKRMADGYPIVHSKSFLPYAQCECLREYDLSREGLYRILDLKEETRIQYLDRTIEAEEATSEDAVLLDLARKKPIQHIRSVGYNCRGIPVEYTISRYRGDRNQFTVTTVRKNGEYIRREK